MFKPSDNYSDASDEAAEALTTLFQRHDEIVQQYRQEIRVLRDKHSKAIAHLVRARNRWCLIAVISSLLTLPPTILLILTLNDKTRPEDIPAKPVPEQATYRTWTMDTF